MNSTIGNLCNNLKGFYKQKKAYKTHLNVVEPVKVELGSTISSNVENELNNQYHFGYYVPMQQSLQNWLNVVSVDSLNFQLKTTDGIKNDIFDGENIKQKIRRENTLALALYLDDVEVVNPIGAHKKKHKLSNFKYILFNTY